jgi:predicted unusual protein kinase regulating ubiquinone biosynthesis (AarF/ABC1/UbiB family)
MGQMLSTRGDVIPVEVTQELEKLVDTVPPSPFVGRLLCQTLQRLKPVGGRAAKLSEVLTRDDGALYGAPS